MVERRRDVEDGSVLGCRRRRDQKQQDHCRRNEARQPERWRQETWEIRNKVSVGQRAKMLGLFLTHVPGQPCLGGRPHLLRRLVLGATEAPTPPPPLPLLLQRRQRQGGESLGWQRESIPSQHPSRRKEGHVTQGTIDSFLPL